jgi:uncharacterized protein
MNHKSAPFEIKASDDQAGTFEALVSVFGNVDRVNDRVVKGAFAKSLERWRESGDPLPVVLSHRWDDVHSHIGVIEPHNISETEDGLYVKGQLDLDNPVAMQTYRLMKRRSLKAFSFGYEVLDEKRTRDGVNELVEVDLHEVGPTLVGANPDAQLQAVKSAIQAEATGRKPQGNADEDPDRGKSQIARVRREIRRSQIASR